jgi:hypothetical protein
MVPHAAAPRRKRAGTTRLLQKLRAQANAVWENGLSPWGLRALAKTAVDRPYRDSRRLLASKQPASSPVMGKQHCFARSARAFLSLTPSNRFARPSDRELTPPAAPITRHWTLTMDKDGLSIRRSHPRIANSPRPATKNWALPRPWASLGSSSPAHLGPATGEEHGS